jgi:hypothetical protein
MLDDDKCGQLEIILEDSTHLHDDIVQNVPDLVRERVSDVDFAVAELLAGCEQILLDLAHIDLF